VLAGRDPSTVYGQLAGLGNAGVFILMALVSVAVVVFFRRHDRSEHENLWTTMVAPTLAAIAMCSLVVFALANFDLVVGASSANFVLLILLAASFVIGLVIAAEMKRRRPADYETPRRRRTLTLTSTDSSPDPASAQQRSRSGRLKTPRRSCTPTTTPRSAATKKPG
jgi:amino acid transporter